MKRPDFVSVTFVALKIYCYKNVRPELKVKLAAVKDSYSVGGYIFSTLQSLFRTVHKKMNTGNLPQTKRKLEVHWCIRMLQ